MGKLINVKMITPLDNLYHPPPTTLGAITNFVRTPLV